jgi:hypothetical protein
MMLPFRYSGPFGLVGVVVGVVETSGIQLSVLRADVTVFARLDESFTFQPSSKPRRLEPFPFPSSDPEFPEHGVNILAALGTVQGNGASKKTVRSCNWLSLRTTLGYRRIIVDPHIIQQTLKCEGDRDSERGHGRWRVFGSKAAVMLQ